MVRNIKNWRRTRRSDVGKRSYDSFHISHISMNLRARVYLCPLPSDHWNGPQQNFKFSPHLGVIFWKYITWPHFLLFGDSTRFILSQVQEGGKGWNSWSCNLCDLATYMRTLRYDCKTSFVASIVCLRDWDLSGSSPVIGLYGLCSRNREEQSLLEVIQRLAEV